MNLVLINKEKKYRRKLLPLRELKQKSQANIKKLQLNPPFPEFIARNLSGGNQQKVVVAKWMNIGAKIFIFDEPTRGIDVGAKVELYTLMNELAAQGAAILMISSELPEILGMSDRVIVMHEGRITAELPIGDATEEKIMFAAAGGM
jgi:ribose transport system ATP-binding protein